MIADNRLALDAGWDEEMLALELADLSEAEYDLALTGFEDAGREQRAEESQTGRPAAQSVPTPGTRRMGASPAWFAGSRNGNAQPRRVGR